MKPQHTPGPWRFEKATKTIRSVPANYWIASMNSCDGAVDHEANGRLIAAAPDLFAALADLVRDAIAEEMDNYPAVLRARAAIAKAKGG